MDRMIKRIDKCGWLNGTVHGCPIQASHLLGYWMNVRSIFVLRANFSALAVGGGEGRRGGRGRGVDNHVKSMERGGPCPRPQQKLHEDESGTPCTCQLVP